MSDLLAREQHEPRPEESGEPGKRPPAQRRRRLAGACAGLLAIGGAIVVGSVIAEAPQDAPQVERQREAAPKPRAPTTKAAARDVVRAAKPTESEREQERAVLKQPERPKQPPAEPPPQQFDNYRDMAKQLRKQYSEQYGQG